MLNWWSGAKLDLTSSPPFAPWLRVDDLLPMGATLGRCSMSESLLFGR